MTGAHAATTPNVLWLDTKTESEDDFETHNCAFEVAFDEYDQLYMQWWVSIIKSNFIIMHSTAKIRHRLWHLTRNVSEDGTAMLKVAIKSTFQNTAPKDVRWLLSFMPSSFLPCNWARNRKIHVTFYSRCLTSCRIFRKCIFIISSRGYITYPDRWSGFQVSAAFYSCSPSW